LELPGWFVLEQSSNRIAELTGLNKRPVLRATRTYPGALKTGVPKQLSGIVEVDETHLGGKWKNKKKHVRDKGGTKRGRDNSKQPIFKAYARSEYVLAEAVENLDASTPQPPIKRRVEQGPTIYPDTWKNHTGNCNPRIQPTEKQNTRKEFSDCKGTHINGLEGF